MGVMSSPPNANYTPEICRWCGGSGHDRDQQGRLASNPRPCTSCNGQGRLHVADPPVICPNCTGTGVDPSPERPGKRCASCYGTGWSLRWIPPRQP